MGKVIKNPKTYEGRELEQIFFRPMLTGPDAADLGVKVMYNMPVPTTLNFWKRAVDVLKAYKKGWDGGAIADKSQKTINLSKVKSEMSYSASDYFSMIYELITNRSDVNLDDLSGTELEAAETALFKEAIAEAIRVTMWCGDTSRESGFNSFDGFLKRIKADIGTGEDDVKSIACPSMATPDAAEAVLKNLLDNAPLVLKQFKDQGNLVYLVTSDVYQNYEESLDAVVLESAYAAKQNGRPGLKYKGIPLVDVKLAGYLPTMADMPQSFAILTDRRNLAMAVNTSDFPGTEVRMWYNPDEMENRQRAIFMAGCDYLLPELIVIALPVAVTGVTLDKNTLSVAKDATATLIATVSPDDAGNKTVIWSSSDDTKATVDATGKVTGVAAGSATITVKTVDGAKTATCAVTITE
ncbi:Ig-like domain-containing protein [Alistipes indistinctus]|jgi:hypothetical protein|uniref:Ig-like domain-containing protein n=1 Tax=Alistipes indistinctus TaxID=626932 RepID=UPI00205B638F|nr:Ig domain-containing protein [Alistipes indistinctus]DAV65012.1 MAG TPA: major capsid protein [Caudoviricetes sp.]